MMRGAATLIALLLAACAPQAPRADAVSNWPDCATLELTGALEEARCALSVGGGTLRVSYLPLAAGAAAGTVSIEVLGDDGVMVQAMREPDVPEYRPVDAQDVDGDGRADVIVRRFAGNANAEMALWIFNQERGVYERVGAVNGAAVERTHEGLIAVPARSSAVEWIVAYYRLDEGGLHPIASVGVEAPAGRSPEPSCRLTEAPGVALLNLTEDEAQAKFCAEPAAAGVFQ